MNTSRISNAPDLFLCTTPLQMVIAQKIIEDPSYDGKKPDFLLSVLSDTERYRHYFQVLSESCNHSLKLSKPKFPFHLCHIAKHFAFKRYRRIYLASIDSSFFQILVSHVRFFEIRTFDDGTANITKSSMYYQDPDTLIEKAKRVVFWIAGNRYSRKRFIDETLIHYTIYPALSNITQKISAIELTGESIDKFDTQDSITIILGTCYRQVVKKPAFDNALINELENYANRNLSSNSYYIPHPRDERNCLTKIPRINDARISEDVIAQFLTSGKKVTLIGFSSSVQFSFLTNKNVTNVILLSNHLRNEFIELAEVIAKHNGIVINISATP